MCGALSGAVLALSMVDGRGAHGEDRALLYEKTQKLVGAFVQQLGGAMHHTSGKDGTTHTLAIPHSEIVRQQTKHR